jgi:hypothetical protein
VTVELVFELLFAVSAVVAAAGFVAAVAERVSARLLVLAAGVVGATATAGWVILAFEPSEELAVSAAGLTVSAAALGGAAVLRGVVDRTRMLDEPLDRAKAEIAAVVAAEGAARATELERSLARARADSVSALLDEERRLSEDRRAAFATREARADAALAERLAVVQGRVAERLSAWSQDLERSQEQLSSQVTQLAQRQEQLIAGVEKRLVEESQRLEVAGDDQRQLVARLRTELMQAARDAVSEARAELDAHALERRRALTEVEERLRVREHELGERIEREAVEAARRIHATLQDVERRQVEQLQRVVERAAERYSEEAGMQFETSAKSAREQAAKRLSRELDRSVEMFARDSQQALAERLAELGDSGARRIETRLASIADNLERQRDEFLQTMERQLTEAERDVRERTRAAILEGEAQRGALEARLAELARRIEDALEDAEQRLATLGRE